MAVKNNKAEIDKASAEALKTIAYAANEASKVIANATAEALKVSNLQHTNNAVDHDLLIELKTKMDDLKADIKELKDGTSTKIDSHETRITALETSKTRQNVMMSIGIGLLTILTGILTYHVFQH